MKRARRNQNIVNNLSRKTSRQEFTWLKKTPISRVNFKNNLNRNNTKRGLVQNTIQKRRTVLNNHESSWSTKCEEFLDKLSVKNLMLRKEHQIGYMIHVLIILPYFSYGCFNEFQLSQNALEKCPCSHLGDDACYCL